MDDFQDFQLFADLVRRHAPRVALILGSGLGELAARFPCLAQVPYHRIPGLERPTVPGHQGMLSLGTWAGQDVLVFSGRIHFYEGHSWRQVVQPIQVARDLGAGIVILTNAAGGIRDDLVPGSLLALTEHIEWNMKGQNLSQPYDPDLNQHLQATASAAGVDLSRGRYAQVTGPCYETPAEIRALQSLRVDAVGMSTATEANTAFALGMRCAAISCITNRAAGLGQAHIDHEEVLASSSKTSERLANLLEHFLARLAE